MSEWLSLNEVLSLQEVDRNKYFKTKLFHCVSSHPIEFFKFVALYRTAPDYNCISKGRTPIFYSCRADRRVVDKLIELGANPNVKDNRGITPFEFHVDRYSNWPSLLAHPQVNIVFTSKLLGEIAKSKYIYVNREIIVNLMKRGLKFNQPDADGQTFFGKVCEGNCIENILRYVEMGGDLYTPVMSKYGKIQPIDLFKRTTDTSFWGILDKYKFPSLQILARNECIDKVDLTVLPDALWVI